MWVLDSFYVERDGVRLKKASSLAAFQMGLYIYARTRRVKTQRKTEEYFSHTNAAEPNSGQVVRP